MRRIGAVAALVAALSSATPALAQDAVQQAKSFFAVGAKSYEKGMYSDSIRAFEMAYKLAPRSAVLFSIAQAYKKHFFAERKIDDARKAAAYYQQYLKEVPQGGRRNDATAALTELDPHLRQAAEDAVATPPPPVEEKKVQYIAVTTATRDARVTIDGGAPLEPPFTKDVAAGRHVVKISAEGHFEESRELVLAPGSSQALDVALRERPALLTLEGPSGADVSIDGRFVGSLPLPRPLEVPPGKRLVTVTTTGSDAFVEEITLKRAETRKVTIDLPITGQRKASYVLLAIGGAGIVAGGVMSGLAFAAQKDAQDILAKRESSAISVSDRDDYDAAVTERNDWRRNAGVGFAAGGAFAVVGGLLFLFDSPDVELGPTPPKDDSAPAPTPKEEPMVAVVGAAPAWGPGFVGASLRGRF